jgi:tetratricopeptide (TPR) repeat protein
MKFVLPPRLEAMRLSALGLAEQGDLEGAYRESERICLAAAAEDDVRVRDLAACGRAAYAVELNRGVDELPSLREILMRNANASIGWHASYHLARHYEIAKDFRKALFYARIAVDRALEIGDPAVARGSRNLLGNALLGLCRSREALFEYSTALGDGTGVSPAERGVIVGNLGYCAVLNGNLRDGRRRLLESLRHLRGTSRIYELRTRLDLAFASLEAGRPGIAERHARRALDIAAASGDRESTKNALYLLGEAVQLSGRPAAALSVFETLQRDFYPDQPYISGFLMAVDVRRVVNLHA